MQAEGNFLKDIRNGALHKHVFCENMCQLLIIF